MRLIEILTAVLLLSLAVSCYAATAVHGTLGLFGRLSNRDGSVGASSYWRAAAAGVMAVNHVNQRVMPFSSNTSQLLPANFSISFDMEDSFSSPIVSVRRTIEFTSQGKDVIIGSFRSAVSGPIALAASASFTPVISFGSTSPSLSDEATYPFFSRSIPSDFLLAGETVKIMKTLGWTRVSVLYVDDAYGSGFAQTIAANAPAQGITVISSQGFLLNNEASLSDAMSAIKASIAKIVIVIAFGDQLAKIAAEADANGLIGEGYVWVVSGDPINMNVVTESSDNVPLLIQRMTGWLSLVVDPFYGQTGERFQAVFDAEPIQNKNHSLLRLTPELLAAPCDAFCAYTYDAVWTAAIAISRTSVVGGELDQAELLRNIQGARFEGASGRVQYDEQGDRSADGMQIVVQNIAESGERLAQTVKWEWSPSEEALIQRSDSPPTWPGGLQTWTPPSDGFACPDGLVLNEKLLCAPCPAFTKLVQGSCQWFNATVGILSRLHGIDGDPLGDYAVRYGAAAMLAAYHVNTRSTLLVPEAEQLIPPGFRFTFDMQDTYSAPTIGVAHALNWGHQDQHAIVGAYRSAVSGPVALAAATSNTPVVSWGSTSPSLSDKLSYPLFSRSVPSDTLAAEVTAKVVKELGWSRVAVLFVNDAYGSGLAQDISVFAQQVEVVVQVSLGYTFGDLDSMRQAISVIKESGARVFIVVAFLGDFAPMTAVADELGLLAPSYVWISAGDPVSPSGVVASSDEPELTMERMAGWLSVEVDPLYGENTRRLAAAFAAVQDLAKIDHPLLGVTREVLAGSCDAFCAYIYDAVWTTAIAIARTSTANQVLDKDELLSNIRGVSFVGASGPVSYSESGDRSGVGMSILVKNFVIDTGEGRRAPALTQDVTWRWTAEAGLSQLSANPPIWPGGYPASWTPPPDGSACAAGSVFSSETLACTPCPAGSFQNESICSPCELGSHAPHAGMEVCLPCQAGFANMTGMSSCFPCPENSARVPVTAGTSIRDCECLLGFFSAEGPGTACSACPTGALCQGQTSLPYPVAGFWGDAECVQFGGDKECPSFDLFLECNPAENCAGGPDFECETGRAGRLCLLAQKGWTIVGGFFWFECGEYGHLNTVLGIGAVILVWFGINQVASGEYDALNVALLFVQITGLISTYGLKWHENLRILNIALGVANFDVDFVTPLCLVDWTGSMAFYLQLLLPFIFGIMYALLSLVVELWKLRGQAQKSKRKIFESIMASTLKNFLSFVLIVYHTLCLKSFSAFRCTRFPDGKLYNTFNPEMECWKGSHIGMVVFAALYIPLILVGVPAGMTYEVYKHKKAGTLQRPDVLWQWGFAHGAYENAVKWWEGMITGRRFCIALILVGMDEPMLQGAATIVVLTAFLTAHVVSSPYISASVDILDFASLCGSVLYVLAGMLMYPSITVKAQGVLCAGEALEGDRCRKDASVKEALSIISLCVILLTLCVCGVLTYSFVQEARHSKKAANIIRKGIENDQMPTVSDAGDEPSGMPKVGLEEMLEGNKLLRWVRRLQPSGSASVSPSTDSQENVGSSIEAYWMLDTQVKSLDTDLTQFSSAQRAILMRHLCEIPGIVDYLCGDHDGGKKLLDFVESMATFSGKALEHEHSFPIFDLFNFQHRPLVTYWLMVSHPEDRANFLKLVDAICIANGRVRKHLQPEEYCFSLMVNDSMQHEASFHYNRHQEIMNRASASFKAHLAAGDRASRKDLFAHDKNRTEPTPGRDIEEGKQVVPGSDPSLAGWVGAGERTAQEMPQGSPDEDVATAARARSQIGASPEPPHKESLMESHEP